ncbi:MAG: hypothetical protein M1835_006081 [Candelina submexicana]|nr:MAG: hypothetical protein M1835_006081 [Candelina submexicana]
MSSIESTQPPSHAAELSTDDPMIVDTEHYRRTDHDRQGEVAEPSPAALLEDHNPLTGEGTEREQDRDHETNKKPCAEVSAGSEPPNDGTDPLYLVCKSRKLPKFNRSPNNTSAPLNLISLYGLEPLAAGVARTDPVTGEKINKLRKSYEGKVKDMGLSGKNKAVKNPEGKLGLVEMVQWPDDEWQIQKVGGKDVEKGLGNDILAKLEQAMNIERGPLPDDKRWVEALALDPPVQPQALPTATSTVKKQTQHNNLSNGTTPRLPNAVGSTSAEPPRPKRTGKKRRYDEHSFEGYGEGYLDDDVDMVGGDNSAGEGDEEKRGSSFKKKRRKDYGGAHSPGLGDRGGSYIGMVDVGAYGR